MKESLESARNIYHTLIIISGIILTFSFNIKYIANPYRHAKHELEEMESIYVEHAKRGNIKFLYRDGGIVMLKKELDKYRQEDVRQNKTIDSLIDIVKSIDKSQLKRLNLRKTETAKLGVDNFLKNKGWQTVFYPDSMQMMYFKAQAKNLGNRRMFASLWQEHPYFIEFVLDNDFKSVSEFKRLLSEKADKFDSEKKGNIDLLGMSVAIDDMHLIAPFISIALQLYLLAHMLHIYLIIKLIDDVETLKSFPWLPLFKNWFSYGIYGVSIALPFASVTEILSKSYGSNADSAYWRFCFQVAFGLLWIALASAPQFIHYQKDKVEKKYRP